MLGLLFFFFLSALNGPGTSVTVAKARSVHATARHEQSFISETVILGVLVRSIMEAREINPGGWCF